MAGDYVFVGIWTLFKNDGSAQTILTISDFWAFLLLGLYGILVNITQGCFWKLDRQIMVKLIYPIHDPDDPIVEIGQSDAVRSLLPGFRGFRGPAGGLRRVHVAPWFGIAALLNIVTFLAAGFLIPYFFTYGTLETPIVKSTSTNHCADFFNFPENYDVPLDVLTRNFDLASAVYDQCQSKGNLQAYCSPLYQEDVVVKKSVVSECPFDPSMCRKGSPIIRFTHYNITPWTIGVNSGARVGSHHRLTCTPILLDQLSRVVDGGVVISTNDFNEAGEENRFWENSTLLLNTYNGPNKFSNKKSGPKAAYSNGPYDLNLLPWADFYQSYRDTAWDMLHPSLRVKNGQVMVVVRRGGPTKYPTPIDDPFFSAHVPDGHGYFLSDQEATALGCVEQFQHFYTKKDGSVWLSPWDTRLRQYLSVVWKALIEEDFDSMVDGTLIMRVLPQVVSVQKYLRRLSKTPAFLESKYRPDGIVPGKFDTKVQWIDDVEAWFIKAFYFGLREVQMVAVNDFDPSANLTHKDPYKSVCDRILIQDGNYTNIEWVPLLSVFGVSIFTCIMSLDITMDLLQIIGQRAWKSFKKAGKGTVEVVGEIFGVVVDFVQTIKDTIQGRGMGGQANQVGPDFELPPYGEI